MGRSDEGGFWCGNTEMASIFERELKTWPATPVEKFVSLDDAKTESQTQDRKSCFLEQREQPGSASHSTEFSIK
jgi:hypothetical protein